MVAELNQKNTRLYRSINQSMFFSDPPKPITGKQFRSKSNKRPLFAEQFVQPLRSRSAEFHDQRGVAESQLRASAVGFHR